MAQSYFLGIDSGSTASKVVIINEQGAVTAKGLCALGAGTAGTQKAVDSALEYLQLELGDMTMTCATGYGRNLVSWAGMQMSELSCHAKGASLLFPDAHTIIDIGGQDAKVLSIGQNGQLDNFVMNDKCAAGTGRFLDVMASVFGCKVSELSSFDLQSEEVAAISSTCTVFAESEVISKLAAGVPIPNIVAGIHASVVERTVGLVRRLGTKPAVAMTGGVSLNTALRNRLQERLATELLHSEEAQFNGAIGAALFAREKASA